MERHIIETNGVRRAFEGKRWGNEFRVYRIEGDVTDEEALGEAAQELALKTQCEKIELRL